jgi:histidine ammonia-lyase
MASHEKTAPRIQLDRPARDKMMKSRAYIDHIIKQKKPIYGINTGLGFLSNVHVEEKDLIELQKNFVRSHCVGVGTPLTRRESRLLLLLRTHALALGYSGVRPELVEHMIAYLNNGIIPVIPSEGSVGASGDLAPLAHLALTLIGEGEVYYQGKRLQTSVVLSQVKLKPITLQAKEALSLFNGTQLMLTYCLLLLSHIHRLTRVADVIAACSTEAMRGSLKPFDARVQELRPFVGQRAVADNVRRLMSESEIVESHKNCGKIQDPYSFRCIPQVHGAARDYAAAVSHIIQSELHAVTDNPIIFADDQEVLNGGNFHGAPLGMGLDTLAIAVSELGSISERRIEKLTNPHFSDLPPFLVKNAGLNSGVMLAQVTAAALASENKILSHPASVDTIPTSADKEDHVSMGPLAGRKLKKIILNVERILTIEAMCARQGLWLLEPLKPGLGVQAAYKKLSSVMPPIERDRVLADDVENVHRLLFRTSFLPDIRAAIGELY